MVKFLCCLFFIFPLGLLNYKLTSSSIRMLYGFSSGFALCFFMYGFEIYHLLIDAIVTHYFIVILGRKVSAFWILIFTIGHLSFIHIERIIYSYGEWTLEISTIYMMTVIKFSAYAFSYEDGAKDNSDLYSNYWKEKKIVNKPTFFESMTYFFHFSSCIVGPSLEFVDFKRFIYLEKEYENIPFKAVCKATVEGLGQWILLSATYIGGTIYFPLKYLTTNEFGTQNYIKKLFIIYFSGLVIRSKYYSGWCLSHTAMMFSGITYYQKFETKNPNLNGENNYISNANSEGIIDCFDKVVNFVWKGVELEPNPKIKLTKWNITVHLWLKYSVFLRLKSLSKGNIVRKISPELITFMVSAFWHGFYPNYYIFFFFVYVLEQCSAILMAHFSYFQTIESFKNSKLFFLYYIIGGFHQNIMNFLGLFFCLTTMEDGMAFAKNMMFYPGILLVLIYIGLLSFSLTLRITENKEKKENK